MRSQPPAPGQASQSPASSSSKSNAAVGGDAEGGCTCGFCDGVKVEVGHDPRTGEVESFERMSRRARCPVCGGKNVQYRDSYTAHCAEVAREKGRTRHAYFVTLVLDRGTADRAGVDGDESYQVLAGSRGVWTRSRRAVRRRDPDAQYLGTLSARPSDGRWHAHVVVFTSLSRHELARALHVTGADAYISAPSSESHEAFGARKGAYAFDNAAEAPSSRFISSRGGGVGYDSKEAVERRRDAVRGRDEDGRKDGRNSDGTGARSLSRNQQRERDEQRAGDEHDRDDSGPSGADRAATSGDRAPPIRCDGQIHDSLESYHRAVRGTLTRRVGTRVYVRGLGNCKLLKVAGREGDRLSCTVAPLDVEATATVTVAWPQITATNEPLVSSNRPSRAMSDSSDSSENDPVDENDPVERFYDEARFSTVTTELGDGRRRVTVKDHETGEMREHMKPPRS